jgi:cell wall-associated NlpC family hydrolase
MATWRSELRQLTRPVLAALLGAAMAVTAVAPAHAQPTEIPDPGARPAPDGEVILPDGSTAPPPAGGETVEGPLAAEIAAVEIQIEQRTARLLEIEPQLVPAEAAVEAADQAWRTAEAELARAQAGLDELVEESFKGAAALPPELFVPELRDLSAYAPVPVDAPIGVEFAARELLKARDAELTAAQALAAAQETDRALEVEQRTLTDELAGLRAELEELLERNVALQIQIIRAREAAEQRNADNLLNLQPVAGFRAGEDAIEAVRFALRQLGKPYLWGAEGPDRYDCSGLMWDAYRFAGHSIPRVANDQFQGTQDKLVTRSAAVAQRGLLPGDLVFFSRDLANPRAIHHVGMYVGGGRMVHAPNRNDVVKVSTIWWSQFFGATRVVDAVPVAVDPEPSPRPGPAPTQPPTQGSTDPPSFPTPGPTTAGPGPTTPGPEPSDPGPDPEPSDPPDGEPTAPPDGEPTPPPDGDPTGEPMVTVPVLTGRTAADAASAIEALGLVPIEGTPVTDGTCTPGQVVSQDPPAGTEVPIGFAVTYRVCQAPETPDPETTADPAPTESPVPTPS